MPQFIFCELSFVFSRETTTTANKTSTIGSLVRWIMFQDVFPGTSWWKFVL